MFNRVNAQFGVIFCSLTFFSALKGTSGSGKVTVLLVNYANSKSQLADGGCCDNLSWCVSKCDNFFRLCFALTSSSDKCALWKGWTKVFNSDSFTFPGAGGSLGNGITNPVTYSFTRWQPIVFDVEVWDNDDGNIIGAEKDFVDRYSLTIQSNPSPNLATATVRRHKLTGQGSSHLNVEVKVFCDANYFVPDCSAYCVSRNDNTGHYTCDYTRGQKVCLSGWYGSDCLMYCVSRNDSLGHYSCDGNGHRQCLDYWYGRDCLVYCKPRNDSQGHYTCNGTGHVDCLLGWRGENCTEVNTTSSSMADSTTTIGLVPTATRATVSFTSSSLYSSPQSSVYDETNPSSLRSTRTFKTHGSSFNKGGGGTCTSSLATGTQTILTEFESSSHITTNTVHTINTLFSTLRLNESDASESFWVPRHSVELTMRPSLVSTSSEFRDFERTGTTKGMFLSKHGSSSRSVDIWSPVLETIPSSLQTSVPFLSSKTTVVPLCSTEQRVTLKIPETTRISVSGTQHRSSSRLEHLLSLSQFSSLPSASSIHAQFISTSSIVSLCTTDKGVTDQPGKTARMVTSITQLNSTLELEYPSSLTVSSPQTYQDAPTLKSTSSIGLVYTKKEMISSKPTFDIVRSASDSTVGLQHQPHQTSSHQEVPGTSVSSPQTAAPTVMSTTSVGSRCASREELTMPSGVEHEETSSIPGLMVKFEPVEEEQELVVPWVVHNIKTVLVQQLNLICSENAEACNLSDDELHSTWFCPRDITVEIEDVTTEGATFKITSTLPPPLNGMIPLQTLMEVLKRSKEDLEDATQATISWIPVYGLTTPRSYEKSDRLARVSSRQKTSPLPYIFGIAGAGLVLVVVLLIARAKRANRVYPNDEDETPPSPSYECQPDTIVLLSRTKAEYADKKKEKESLKEDYDVQPAGSVDEDCL